MARYVSNISEIIIDAVDIEQLISEYVPLKRAGANVKGLCPFHNEKTPSFVVSKDKQMYHCFGCGASGNAIGFVMAIENLDFLDALEHLADKGNVDLDQYLDQSQTQSKTYKPEDKSQKKKYQDITKHAARFFYMNLKKNEEAIKYFSNREISEETQKTFGLGYAEDEWSSLLEYLGRPPYTGEDLDKVGLVVKKDRGGYYDRFRGRVIFPIIDVQGKVVGFGGRIIGDGQPKYLNSPETPLFNKSNTLYNLNLAKNVIKDEKRLIVVEGYMDVIALYQAGIKNVVATLGTALTIQHGRLMKRYVDEIIIAYDSDDAGQKATQRSVEILEKANLKVRVLLLTDGLDPDEYLKKYGVDTLKTKLKQALSYTDYQLQLLRQKYDLDFEDDRRQFYQEAKPLIKSMGESAIKTEYIKSIAKWSRLDEETIKKDVYKRAEVQMKPQAQVQRKRSKLFTIEVRLLYLALLNKESFDKIFELIKFNDVQDPKIKKVFIFLKGYYQVMEKFNIESCIDHLSIEDIQFIQKVIEHSIEPGDTSREIQMNSLNFKVEIIKQQIIMVSNHIMNVKESVEISDSDKESQLKTLSAKLAELKQSQVQLMKALGR